MNRRWGRRIRRRRLLLGTGGLGLAAVLMLLGAWALSSTARPSPQVDRTLVPTSGRPPPKNTVGFASPTGPLARGAVATLPGAPLVSDPVARPVPIGTPQQPAAPPTSALPPAASPAASATPASIGRIIRTIPAQVTPPPPGAPANRLTQFAVADPDHLWIAVDNKLLATTDHGRHWTTQFQGEITGLDFVDARHGWIEAGGVIQGTTDGGQHWAAQYQAGWASNLIGFISPRYGWIAVGFTLLATQDGGYTWQPLPQSRPVEVLRFFDSRHGWGLFDFSWYSRPELAWTQDGGRQWAARSVPPCPWSNGGGSFSASSAYTAWIVCAQNRGGGPLATLNKTTDGGQTWNGFAPTWVASDDFSYDPNALFFLDNQHGWVGLDVGSQEPVGTRRYLLQGTTDGGQSWQTRVLMDRREAGGDKISEWVASGLLQYRFTSSLQGYAIYARHTDGSDSSLLATPDGGRSWTALYGRPPTPEGPIRFFDAHAGVGVGLPWDAGAFFQTGDGGRNWTPIGTLAPTCGTYPLIDVRDLSFPDRRNGWALVNCFLSGTAQRQVLARTTDGGAHWHIQQTRAEQGWVSEWWTISFLDPRNGYLAGDAGLDLRLNAHGFIDRVLGYSSDGGATFRQGPALTQRADQIRFVSNSVGWMRAAGQLFRTTDGGGSWQLLLPEFVQDFDLHADGKGWALVLPPDPQPAAILATTDGGQTWTRYEFSIVPPAVSGTTDGGQSWTIYSYTALHPQALSFADAQHGWLRDDKGRLYATTDGGASWTFVP